MAAELSLARATLGLSRLAVSRRAGVSRSTVERVEAGDASVQVDTLAAVLAAVGLDLVLRAYEGGDRSLRDARHMRQIDAIRTVAAPSWQPRLEVGAGDHGRAADLVMYGAEEVIHLEVERSATDFQAQLRRAQEKRDFLGRRDARPIRLVLAIEYTRANRDALAPHAALLGTQLPASSREVLRALRSGRPLGRDGLLWLRPRGFPRVRGPTMARR